MFEALVTAATGAPDDRHPNTLVASRGHTAPVESHRHEHPAPVRGDQDRVHGLCHDVHITDQSTRGLTVWLTGLPGSGKTTSALALHAELERTGRFVALLDGDELRHGISSDLGFSNDDRDESVRRAGEIALLLAQQGAIAIVSLVSPRRRARDEVRRHHSNAQQRFFEVHVAAGLETCERRDPKALYRQSRSGSLTHMTGVDDPYEPPLHPELVLNTDRLSVVESTALLATSVLDRLDELKETTGRDISNPPPTGSGPGTPLGVDR